MSETGISNARSHWHSTKSQEKPDPSIVPETFRDVDLSFMSIEQVDLVDLRCQELDMSRSEYFRTLASLTSEYPELLVDPRRWLKGLNEHQMVQGKDYNYLDERDSIPLPSLRTSEHD